MMPPPFHKKIGTHFRKPHPSDVIAFHKIVQQLPLGLDPKWSRMDYNNITKFQAYLLKVCPLCLPGFPLV